MGEQCRVSFSTLPKGLTVRTGLALWGQARSPTQWTFGGELISSGVAESRAMRASLSASLECIPPAVTMRSTVSCHSARLSNTTGFLCRLSRSSPMSLSRASNRERVRQWLFLESGLVGAATSTVSGVTLTTMPSARFGGAYQRHPNLDAKQAAEEYS